MLPLLFAPLVSGALAAPCYRPPVDGRIVDPYREPACAYCPGHRGVEFETEPGEAVLAVADGTVTFVGDVAGIRYVVVAQADGLRATYGMLRSTRLRPPEKVTAGEWIGAAGERVYFGFRRGAAYVDPTPLLGSLRSRPRLVPTDGSPRIPAAPPRLVCRNPMPDR